jgi:putative DNA primase/helicase
MANAMQELMDMKIWMLWRWATDQNGKPTKKPFAAGGGATGTDDKWSRTWVTYNEAVKAKGYNSVAAGVGFKIPKGYYFIDIDHKELSDPLVQTILARHDSYAEYSVSGTGIHQYGKCDFTQIPTYIDKDGKTKLDRQFYMKNPNNDMELYIGGITNCFAAFTGNIIEDKPLRECTTAVLTTLDKNMRRKEKTKYSAKRDGDRIDFDIVCNLRKQKNGEKLIALIYFRI